MFNMLGCFNTYLQKQEHRPSKVGIWLSVMFGKLKGDWIQDLVL